MPQRTIKVSVVVPVYNVEQYITKCLDTLVNQTLKEIEIIVVNDGTKDNSQAIIDDFVAKYPEKIISLIKENGGLSDARNYGIPYCRGEYIGFIDSDDYIELTMYEKLYNEAKRTNADVVVCDYVKEYASAKQYVHAREYTSQRDMFLGGLAAAWNKIYRRDMVVRNNLVFPKGLIYEDTEFFCKMIPHISKCGYVNEAFVHYVQREGSIANSQGKKVAMIFDIFDNIHDYYKENGFWDVYQNELTYFTVRLLFGSSMERICRCTSKEERKQLLQMTMEYIEVKMPGWRCNPYLSGWKNKRNVYMRNLYPWNIKLVAEVLRHHFKRIDRKLV